MLEITDYLFGIAVCIVLLVLGFTMVLQREELRRLRRLIRCEHDDRLVLQNDVVALLACSRNIGERLVTQDARQHNLLKKVDIIDLHRETNDGSSYYQVRRMVEQGMGIDEITKICDLGRGEAELLSHVASHRSAA
jgi:Protein of unknown function (DUF2802)